MLNLEQIPAYLAGCLTTCGVIGLLWAVGVSLEEFCRWKADNSRKQESCGK